MSKKILVVDDEKSLAKYIVLRLGKKGYSMSCAFDGESALHAMRRDPPDLLLLDIGLPGINGFDVFEAIHENPLLRNIPVIFVTADSIAADRDFSSLPDAPGFLIKPFEPEELYEKVEKKLAGSKRL